MRFQCTLCGRIIAADPETAGKEVQCALCNQITPVPASRTASGAVIGDFLLRDEIGQGGMGTVYYAHQLSLDRPSAVKLLSKTYASNNLFVEGFVREARAAGKLNHPNIVQAYAVGEEEGLFYFAMEHVDGKTMKEILAEKGKISEMEAISIIQQILEALDYAWKEEELIHRDIKPDNIMLTSNGRAKLADLGLAKVAGEALSSEEGEVMGTPQYISPEQLCGDPLDFRSDQYSLGATFYQFVTGSFPFNGNSAQEIADKHLTSPLVPPKEINPDISPGVSAIIVKMMEKSPQERYQTIELLAEDLRLVKNGSSPIHAGAEVPAPKAPEVPKAPEAPKAPEEPKAPEAPKAPAMPPGLRLPGQGEAKKAPEAPKAPEEPKAPEAPKAPAMPPGLRLPGQGEVKKAPEAPKAPEGSKAPEAPKAPGNPKVPGLKMAEKKEGPKAPPPAAEKKEEKPEEKKEEKKEKKGEKSLANPLMLQRQAEQAQKRKKQLIVKLSILGGILLLLVILGGVACMEPCRSILMDKIKYFAKEANIELPGVELPQESRFMQEVKKSLAQCQAEETSDREKKRIAAEFLRKDLLPETPDEETLYWEVRNIFAPLDSEDYGDKQEEAHNNYVKAAEDAQKAEAEARRQRQLQATEEAIRQKKAADERARAAENTRRKNAITNELNRIRNRNIQDLQKIHKEFFQIVYNFSIPFDEKPKKLTELIAEANKLRRIDYRDPKIMEIRQELGSGTNFLHPDFNKLAYSMNPWPAKFRIAIPMIDIMESGGKQYPKGTEIFIRNVAHKLDRVEDGMIYAKAMGTGIIRKIRLSEFKRKSFGAYKKFIVKALGPEGARLQSQLLFYFFLTKNIEMLREFAPEFPPSARYYIVDFIKNYMDYQKANGRDKLLARQLRSITEFQRIVAPPQPAVRKAPVKKAPPRKVPAKKAAPAKKAVPQKVSPKKK